MKITALTVLSLVIFLFIGCKKEDTIKPIQKDKIIKCAGCPIKGIPVVDTKINRK